MLLKDNQEKSSLDILLHKPLTLYAVIWILLPFRAKDETVVFCVGNIIMYNHKLVCQLCLTSGLINNLDFKKKSFQAWLFINV